MPELVGTLPNANPPGRQANIDARELADANPGQWVQVDLVGRKPTSAYQAFARMKYYDTAIRGGQLFIRRVDARN